MGIFLIYGVQNEEISRWGGNMSKREEGDEPSQPQMRGADVVINTVSDE